jgi:hypothetical protein
VRDNHAGLPEILETFERDENYFGVIQIGDDDNLMAFEFGVDARGYRALRRVLETRPFQTLGAGSCRFYFVPAVRQLPDSGDVEFTVRVEQGKDGRQFEFRGPLSLVEHLMWFFQLKDLSSATHLKRVSSKPRV